MRPRPDRTSIAAGALAIAVVVWGALRCGDGRFWLDEAYTAALADQPLDDLVHTLGHEGGMGPYYLTLWAWGHFGSSEWWLRMLSVAGAAATVGIVFLFTARRVGLRAGALAVALMVCNPFFLYFLTELRAYSWSMFMAVATTWAHLQMRERPTGRRAVVYGATAGLSVALLMLSGGVLVGHAACSRSLARTPTGRRSLLIAAAVAAVLVGPWLPAIFSSNQLDWIAPTTAGGIADTLVDALGGTKWTLVLAAGGLALAVSLATRSREGRPDTAMTVVLAGCVAAPAVLVAVSLVQPVLLARYLAPMFPLAAIAAAVGAVRVIDLVFTTHRLRVAAAMVLVGSCPLGFRGALFTDIARPEDLYSPAAQLAREVRQGDVVAFGEPLEEAAIGWYWTRPAGVAGGDDGAPLEVCRLWFVSRDVNLLSAMTAIAPHDATIASTGYDGWGVVLIDDCG